MLAVLLLMSTVGLFACKSGEADGITSDTEVQTEAPAQRIKLVDEGVAQYTVVYPDSKPTAVMNAVNRFVDGIYEATGVRLETKSDFLRINAVHDDEAKEILFGKTNYSQTAEVMETLYVDHYVMRTVGNKIVVASHDDSYMLALANYFVQNLIEKNLEKNEETGAITLYFEEYEFLDENSTKVLSIGGKHIYNYSIVYESAREGYEDAAKHLQSVISGSTGYVLPIVSDETSESDCEILVGKTNRELSSDSYKRDSAKLMNYELVVKGTKAQIVCGGPFSARECANYLRFTLFNSAEQPVKDGEYYATDLAKTTLELTSGADVRVMTSNILADRWATDSDTGKPISTTTAMRAEIFAAMLVKYKPDVVGAQEVDAPWQPFMEYYRGILKSDYGLDYQALHATHGGKVNFTTIFYRADKYTVLDSAVDVFSYWNNSTYHMRNVTWAKFQSKSNSGEQFILANTHWAHETKDSTTPGVSGEKEMKCSNESAELINSLKSHNVPIFITGDFNAKPTETASTNFLSLTGMKDTKVQASEAGVLINECGGCGSVGQGRSGGNYIDHIYGYGSYSVKRYETLTGNMHHYMTDHSPMIADIKFD